MAAKHEQKSLCGSLRIQVKDCENLGEPKTKEGSFEKAGPYLDGRLTDYGPGYKPRNNLVPLWIWL